MRIAVLGTGTVGQTVAGRLAELGHDVVVGTRDVPGTRARAEFSEWADAHPDVQVDTFAGAAGPAELVVNATSGKVSLYALAAAGRANLAGKVLLDISNALDFSAGFPPSMLVKDTESLGERIQAEFPDVKVVKALNTLTAALMVDPGQLASGDHSVFVSGNDADAKKAVTLLLESFGHTDVIDLGDITTARGVEMFLPLWLRLMASLGTPMFNIKAVR